MNIRKSELLRESIAPGLAVKVLVIILLLFIVALAVNFYYTIHGEKQMLSLQMDREGQNLAQTSAVFATESLLIEDYPVLSTYTEGMLANHPDITSLLIRRTDMKVVAHSQISSNQNAVRQYVADVKIDKSIIGTVEISISTQSHEQFVQAHLHKLVIQSMVIFITLAIVLFFAFRKMITDPIHQLALQASKLKEGNLDHKIETDKTGELHRLAGVLEQMRISVKLSQDEIKAHNKLLDERVSKRTEELRLANKKLLETHSQLLQADKMAAVGQLSAGVAHEINNPIGFVTSNLATLVEWLAVLFELIEHDHESMQHDPKLLALALGKRQQLDFDYIKNELPVMLKETQEGLFRVSDIVKDLKEFSHVSETAWQEADLIKGLKSTLNIVNSDIKYKAKLVLNLQDIPSVECMPSQINQVFLNIIVNACQALEKNGVITITSEQIDEFVCLRISDNGEGINGNDLAHIFDPFYTTKPVGVGTGLGLSVSYGIITAHHGRLEVDSEINQGTCFSIFLPIKQQT